MHLIRQDRYDVSTHTIPHEKVKVKTMSDCKWFLEYSVAFVSAVPIGPKPATRIHCGHYYYKVSFARRVGRWIAPGAPQRSVVQLLTRELTTTEKICEHVAVAKAQWHVHVSLSFTARQLLTSTLPSMVVTNNFPSVLREADVRVLSVSKPHCQS